MRRFADSARPSRWHTASVRMGAITALAALSEACVPAAPPPGPPQSPAASEPSPSASSAAPAATVLAPEARLARAREAFDASRYAEAEAEFRALLEGPLAEAAARGLADALAITGRVGEATVLLESTRASVGSTSDAWVALTTRLARLLHRQGQSEAAMAQLRPLARRSDSGAARLLLGELLVGTGRRHDAEALLMSLIEDYNADRIGDDDAEGLARVGRAAHLLRSPHDANDAFSAAERAQPGHVPTLLYRADLFLEKHDPGHAEEVLAELLARAPSHPEALVRMAQVRLEQSLDFDAARALATKALRVDSTLPRAHFVLGGLALRDLEFEAAETVLRGGLAHSPHNLELLSLRAAVALIADDDAAFERMRKRVLSINPSYSRFYSIIGRYAEWEHRYDRIVELMRDAIAIDDEDAGAHAALGVNLIRAGRESAGVLSLRRAFAQDPFDVRVLNTLNLFEEVIAEGYVTRETGPFRIRYPKAEAALLERYVPALLQRAFDAFREHYGFEPSQPIGIDLFEHREHFAIRTTGLPQTAIQGVCFGKTLASLTPRHEAFNLPMTLWHELAHVFHLQMAKSRVPRWLTEGLAEYETLVERPEWRREHDPDLFRALRAERLPPLLAMNRAFSHARHVRDMATAYYASSLAAVFLVERFGREPMAKLLRRLGAKERVGTALPAAVGLESAAVDREFEAFLKRRLARYYGQFMPLRAERPLSDLVEAARAESGDGELQLRVAAAAIEAGRLDAAKEALARGRRLGARSADLGYLAARLALLERRDQDAERLLEELVAAGHDGFAVQMRYSEVARLRGDAGLLQRALESASRFDPTQSKPLKALWRAAREAGDAVRERKALERLVPLEQHEPMLHRRLLELLLAEKRFVQAAELGLSAIYADMEGARTHALYARALAGVGRFDDARFEFESALLCPARPEPRAQLHRDFAHFLQGRGEAAAARRQLELAEQASTGGSGGSSSPELPHAP